MNPADDAVLQKQFGEELTALKDRPFHFETDAVTAWSIMCQLQLALRHPKNMGPTAELARRVAQGIIDSLAAENTALRKVAEMGWDKRFDQE